LMVITPLNQRSPKSSRIFSFLYMQTKQTTTNHDVLSHKAKKYI
jgi:hypothetical protein